MTQKKKSGMLLKIVSEKFKLEDLYCIFKKYLDKRNFYNNNELISLKLE
jgi:hypothetical protein